MERSSRGQPPTLHQLMTHNLLLPLLTTVPAPQNTTLLPPSASLPPQKSLPCESPEAFNFSAQVYRQASGAEPAGDRHDGGDYLQWRCFASSHHLGSHHAVGVVRACGLERTPWWRLLIRRLQILFQLCSRSRSKAVGSIEIS
ncbi:unnamed protein product [Linum trigynum]|uniref:Uncharacterized protein n=1 Tax=Linum trigynum TaxID=586398 RepID=A0AAV2D5M4_9ROSI